MGIKTEISKNLKDFLAICKSHKVMYLYAFGSSVTPKFNPKTSDVDLIVEIDEQNPIERGEILMSLWDKLEEFFKRKVDMLTPSSLKNPYLSKSIETTKVLIYDRSGEKVFI
jgi:hypothetical protein